MFEQLLGVSKAACVWACLEAGVGAGVETGVGAGVGVNSWCEQVLEWLGVRAVAGAAVRLCVVAGVRSGVGGKC